MRWPGLHQAGRTRGREPAHTDATGIGWDGSLPSGARRPVATRVVAATDRCVSRACRKAACRAGDRRGRAGPAPTSPTEATAMANSQKFIARNRAPRVQIEYDVEVYGAQKKVQIPFVMGVLSDLSGANAADLPPVEERKALDIDVDNFDSRLQSMKPRVVAKVPNTLTGEGEIAVDITFESMDDFSPAAVARKVEPPAKLLEARTQLANLDTYMDGKAGAENLIAQAIRDPALLQALTSAAKPADGDNGE